MRSLILPLLLSLLLAGCGYKPSSRFAHDTMGDSVSTQVIISLHDPENSVLIKDAVDRAVLTHFKSSLTDRAHSSTHLEIRLKEVGFSALQYDKDGYIIAYRTRTVLEILREKDGVTKRYRSRGSYDFAIEPNAIISDKARFDAIDYSARKAIESFVAQVAAEGARNDH